MRPTSIMDLIEEYFSQEDCGQIAYNSREFIDSLKYQVTSVQDSLHNRSYEDKMK